MKKVTLAAAAALLAATQGFAQTGTATGTASGAEKAGAPLTTKTSAEHKLAKLTPEERKKFEAHARAMGFDPKTLAGQDLATAQKNVEYRKDHNGVAALGKPSNLPPVAPGPQGPGQAQSQALAQANAKSSAQDAGKVQDLMKQQQQMAAEINEMLKKMNDAKNDQVMGIGGK